MLFGRNRPKGKGKSMFQNEVKPMINSVDKSMSIGDVLNIHRGTARIFREFGMQCLGCPHSVMESLEEACAVHGANVDELVHQLNEFLAEAK